MMMAEGWAGRSGEGFSRTREVADPVARKFLWDELTALTGAQYP
jgi:hypothetical protein